MKTMCHPGYHHIDFVETHPSGHLMYGYAHLASVRFEHSVCPGSLMDILLISTMTRQSIYLSIYLSVDSSICEIAPEIENIVRIKPGKVVSDLKFCLF